MMARKKGVGPDESHCNAVRLALTSLRNFLWPQRYYGRSKYRQGKAMLLLCRKHQVKVIDNVVINEIFDPQRPYFD